MATAADAAPAPQRRRFSGTAMIALFGLFVSGAVWLGVEREVAADREGERQRIFSENDALARAFDEHVRRALQATDTILRFLQHEYQRSGRVTEAMTAFVERARKDPFLNQISLADARGDLLLSAVPLHWPINVEQREHFRVHVAGGGDIFISTPVVNKASGAWSFFASRRLSRPDGSFGGIVAVGLDPLYFSDFYKDSALGSDRGVLLVGRDGIVRARAFQGKSDLGQDLRASPMFKRIPGEPVGHYEVLGSIDQLQRFVSYRALGDFPVVIAVSRLSSSALAPFRRRTTQRRLSALVFTLFVAALCLMLVRSARRTRLQNAQLSAELAERRRAEEALRESQGLLSALMDNTPAAVFVQDLHGQILYSNRAYDSLAGHEAVGRNARELLAPTAEGGGRPALRGRSVALDETIVGDDGAARVFETRMFVVERQGKEPLLGCISADGTGRRRAEEQRLVFERRMQQTQKLESLGVLAGGVAHDFNNLLMVILGNADLALAKSPPESPLRAFIRSIETAAQRAADLTNQMLAYSGKGRFVVEPINLSRLVEEMGHLLAAVIAQNATVVYRLDPDLPPVLADATQIRQVVMNLITNASDAIGEHKGTIAISTRVVDLDPGGPEALPPGRYAVVEVADTGSGMDPSTRERIFDPFFTTKSTGRGLGLASVLGIVQGHAGGIQLTSSPGEGTRFSVLLPVASAPAGGKGVAPPEPSSPEPSSPGAAAAGSRNLVLLVDDEESVRATARVMLEENGFAVITAADGIEAVELFRSRHAGLAAVLLDMSMPRMGGEEACRAMQAVDPRVPVLLMSGYDEHEAGDPAAACGHAGFIRKPYRMQALVDMVRAVIARREPRPA